MRSGGKQTFCHVLWRKFSDLGRRAAGIERLRRSKIWSGRDNGDMAPWVLPARLGPDRIECCSARSAKVSSTSYFLSRQPLELMVLHVRTFDPRGESCPWF